MLSALLGLDRVGLYLNFDKPLVDEELAAFRAMVSRRARREPLQYILGTQEFMGIDFAVSPAALIPRHDTEVLVAEGIKRAAEKARILDIGVGSGCIAIALAKALPDAEVVGVEASSEALELAWKNAGANGARVTLFEGSLFEPFHNERFDLILSNPPYIPTADLDGLQPEVRDFEPRQALDGGADGLDFYRLITPAAPDYLNPGGWLIFETGIGQADEVRGLFLKTERFNEIFSAKDPNGIERVVGGRVI
jgi:release factor glutamine methyltransferase